VECHSASIPSGGHAFDSYTGTLTAVNVSDPSASAIYIATSTGAMPEGGPALSASEVEMILEWIEAGAQNN
jgi:hypothetical protein